MKIKVEAKRCVRLKGRGTGALYTSTKGGVYDLEKLGVQGDDRDRLLKTEGCSEVKEASSTTKKKGAE